MTHTTHAALLALAGMALSSAAALNSSAPVQLTFPGAANTGPVANAPGIFATVTAGSGSFSGSWAAPVSAAYQGTFTGTGNYPSGANSGSSAFSFSGWAGGIPSGIFVGLGDLDLSENLTLTAFDSSNNQITTPWLNDAVFLSANVASELVAANMPGYKFSAGVYSFYGSFVPGNPSVLVSLPTSQALGSIQVTKDASFGVTLSAPTTAAPEPGSMALLGLGLAGFGLLKFRRK